MCVCVRVMHVAGTYINVGVTLILNSDNVWTLIECDTDFKLDLLSNAQLLLAGRTKTTTHQKKDRREEKSRGKKFTHSNRNVAPRK